jgi:hypothetical protein
LEKETIAYFSNVRLRHRGLAPGGAHDHGRFLPPRASDVGLPLHMLGLRGFDLIVGPLRTGSNPLLGF